MDLRPPNTARGFEPVGGIAGYIRKLRLSQAFQEITAAGFKNISAFSRLFRTTYGVSPREAREAKLKGVSLPRLRPTKAKARR